MSQAGRGLETDLAALGADYEQKAQGITNQRFAAGLTPSYTGPLIQQGAPANANQNFGKDFLAFLNDPGFQNLYSQYKNSSNPNQPKI